MWHHTLFLAPSSVKNCHTFLDTTPEAWFMDGPFDLTYAKRDVIYTFSYKCNFWFQDFQRIDTLLQYKNV